MKPMTFDDFVGNKDAVAKVKLALVAAEQGNKVPPLGFFGPPGFGKTTLARIIAKELKRTFVLVDGQSIKNSLTFRGLVMHPDNLVHGAIILVDECHLLPKRVQEGMLTALDDSALLITSHKDQIFTDKVPDQITFILATTHTGYLREALLSRLEPIEFFEYNIEERQEMAVKLLAREYSMTAKDLTIDGLYELSFRARNGRDITKFCQRLTTYMKKEKETVVTKAVVEKVFELYGIDINGLTKNDRRILDYLSRIGIVGVDTLEAYLHLSKQEIMHNIEPYLLRKGFIVRQASGRTITPNGLQALRGQRIYG
jgi:Holliday junction DNA helicase RuvB